MKKIGAFAGLSVCLAMAALLPVTRALGEPDSATARLAAASRLLADSGSDARTEAILQAMRGLFVKLVASHGKTEAQAGGIVDDLLMLALRSHLPELDDAFVHYWAGAMSVDELDTVDRFYRTPTGRKLVAIQTRDVPLLVAIGQQWGRRAAADVLAAQRETLRRKGVSL